MYGVKVHWAVKGVAGDKAGETQTRVKAKLRENHEIDNRYKYDGILKGV